jgi:hypothetical protein
MAIFVESYLMANNPYLFRVVVNTQISLCLLIDSKKHEGFINLYDILHSLLFSGFYTSPVILCSMLTHSSSSSLYSENMFRPISMGRLLTVKLMFMMECNFSLVAIILNEVLLASAKYRFLMLVN